jgi:2,5-diketo-D-gluconate reductase A
MTLSPTLTFNDGNSIPQLGYGVWQVEDGVAEKVVRQAFEAGFRHIDTARIYGNEAGVGRAIAGSGLTPEEIFITTKLWNADQGYEPTLAAFEESLDRLGLETLDLYLIHWMQPQQAKYVETWKALIELQKRGRVKSIGVSNFTSEGIQRLIDETGVVPAIHQIELHPYFSQQELRDFGRAKGILTQAWSLLGQGGALLEDPLWLPLLPSTTPHQPRWLSPGTWPTAMW